MNKIVELVTEIAKPIVEAQGCELWDVEYVSEGGQWFLGADGQGLTVGRHQQELDAIDRAGNRAANRG